MLGMAVPDRIWLKSLLSRLGDKGNHFSEFLFSPQGNDARWEKSFGHKGRKSH